jgi:hypothetical protein
MISLRNVSNKRFYRSVSLPAFAFINAGHMNDRALRPVSRLEFWRPCVARLARSQGG